MSRRTLWCRECAGDMRQWPWPHQHRTYDVECPDCHTRMAGTVRQILDAAVAHERRCGGIFRPVHQQQQEEAA